jgi:ureidoglycolate hydrolase
VGQRVQVPAAELSHGAWEPFGWLPVEDTDPRDASFDLEFAWADPHVNLISHPAEEIVATGGGLLCEVMFRHDTHTQMLMALDASAVLAVAGRDVDFSRPEDAGRIAAFRLPALRAVVLHRGTWHWGPYPVAAGAVRLLNVQGSRYRQDNASVDLAGRGMAVEVRPDP